MKLRQRLDNLPVGQKLLAALLVLLVTILLVANLTFISAAYWITQESMAPQALQTIGRLVANPQLAARAGDNQETATALLKELDSYTPLRAAAVYGGDGRLLAQLQHGEPLALPKRYRNIDGWRLMEFRSTQLIRIPRDASPPAHLLLVASSELPTAFYTGTLSASLAILVFSILLWLVIARQIKRLITQPINQLEELSRQVTREESYALRAQRGNDDEIGSLANAFNTMLSRIEAREQQLKRTRDEFQDAYDQAQGLAEETRHTNRKLELEVQVRSKIEKKTHRLPELPQQHHRLDALGADRPRRTAVRDPVEPRSHGAFRYATGRSAEPAGVHRLRAAQAVFAAVEGNRGKAPGSEDRAGHLGQGR